MENKSQNTNNYINLKQRGLLRKILLIKEHGGKCEICGYYKNIAALEFHHINPDTKEFQLDLRHLSNTSIDKLKEESNKCKLLCSNCHRELHNLNLAIDAIEYLIEKYENSKIKSLEKSKKISICPVCGNEFDYSKGKIYCSDECRFKDKNYPNINKLEEQYSLLNSWEKVALHFGITRRIVQGIRKRNNKLKQ